MASHGINIFFVIVIYNKECIDSPSISYALKHCNEFKTIIVDNSTIKTGNESFCKNNNITYINMRENAGLSRAYNQAISIILPEEGYIVWADDDTEFPENYVPEMCERMKKQGYMIGLPLVFSGDDLYSPITIDEYGIPKRVKSQDELGDRITGINSGMMVNLNLYESYRYDENMFLDFIDHDLCISYQENGGTIGFINDVILKQNSFFASKIYLKSMLRRSKIYHRDFLVFCKKHGIDGGIAKSKLFHRDIAIGIQLVKQLIKLQRDK